MHGHLICARASQCIIRDVPYDVRMMHRDVLMRLMRLVLADVRHIKPGRLIITLHDHADQHTTTLKLRVGKQDAR